MSTSPSSSLSPRSTVALLMLVVACAHFNRIGISVAGSERIIPFYGIAESRMGLIYLTFLAFYTLAMLPGGWFIDRFGARTALIVLGFGATVFVALTGVVGFVCHDARSVWLGLLVVRSLLGITNAPLHPSAARIVSEIAAPGSKLFVNGLVCFAACAGIASTYYLMGALIDRFDWPVAFLISSGMTLVVAIVWTASTRGGRLALADGAARPRKSVELSDLWAVIRKPSVICITLSYSAHGYFQYMFFYWITYYFAVIQKQDLGVARGYSTMITLAMGAGMLSGGWLADRVPRSFSPRARRALVPVLGLLAAGGIFEMGVWAASPQTTLVAFALAAALIGACEGTFWTTGVDLGGRLGGTAAGLMNTGGNAGGALSPYLTPLVSELMTKQYGADLGWRLGLSLAGIIAVAGAALWWGVIPPESDETVASDTITSFEHGNEPKSGPAGLTST
jgi:MFS family permease